MLLIMRCACYGRDFSKVGLETEWEESFEWNGSMDDCTSQMNSAAMLESQHQRQLSRLSHKRNLIDIFFLCPM